MIWTYLSIAVGGALGSVARFWMSTMITERIAGSFPWGTLLVNMSGSFAIGLIASLAGNDGRGFFSPRLREFLMIGVCGGYTTFSAFSLQTLQLFEQGEPWKAGANAGGSVLACLMAVWLGSLLGMWITGTRAP